MRWLIPIVSNKTDICVKDAIETDDIQLINQDHLIELEKIQNSYFKEKTNGQVFTYKSFNLRTNSLLSNFSKPDNSESYLETKEVLTNIDTIVDNLGDFGSTVFDRKNALANKQYLIQRYNLGLSTIEKQDLKAGKTVYLRKPMTSNDTMTIKSSRDEFTIKGTIWDNRKLYDLYQEAYLPLEWHQ